MPGRDPTSNLARTATDAPLDDSGGRLVAWLPLSLVVVAIVGIAGVTFRLPNTDPEVGALTAFVAGLLVGIALLARWGWSVSVTRVAAAVGALSVIAVQAIPDLAFFDIEVFVYTAGMAALLAGAALLRESLPVRWIGLLATCAVLLVAASSVSVVGGETPDIDVVQLHEQAVAALERGENPYTTGNVAVVETKEYGENELIEEYTYPPINLAWYMLGDAVNGDVRTGGAIALVIAVAMFAFAVATRARLDGGAIGTVALAALALLIANQSMYLMVSKGWTEVTALPFFFAAVALWRRIPVASAIALGLALASKQYFILAVPVLLFVPDPWRFRRVAIATATAFATLLPFLLWDARGLIDGLITHHLTREARPDGATLANLGLELPSLVAVLAALAFGVWVARRAQGRALTILAIAGTFSVFTLLAIRGFVNSWWLVYCLVALAVVYVPRRATTESSFTSDRRQSANVLDG